MTNHPSASVESPSVGQPVITVQRFVHLQLSSVLAGTQHEMLGWTFANRGCAICLIRMCNYSGGLIGNC